MMQKKTVTNSSDFSLFFKKNKKHKKHQMHLMDFVSHLEITHSIMLTGWSAIQLFCLLDVYLLVPFYLMTKKSLYFRNASVTKSI